MNTKYLAGILASFAIALIATATFAAPVPGSFTYQGVLEDAGVPVDTNADFVIRLYDGPTQAAGISMSNHPVSDGQFQLDLHFDPALFDGTDYDLSITVRAPAGVGSFQELLPRQPLATTPYAYHANSADTLLAPAVIEGNEPDHALTINQTDTTNFISALRATRGPTDSPSILGATINRVVEVESANTPIGIAATAELFPIAGLVDANSSPGASAILGEVRADGMITQAGVRAQNNPSGTSAYLAIGNYAADLIGDLRLTGEITKSYNFGTYDRATPIAYGSISSAAAIFSGTPNFSVIWNAASNRYEIEIDDESYIFSLYTTVVTAASTGIVCRTSSVGGRLLVYATNSATQVPQQANFHFVTYKAGGAGAIQGQQRPPLIPLNTPYTDEDLNPHIAPLPPRIPIIRDRPTTSQILRD
jgi:hypothetical protein